MEGDIKNPVHTVTHSFVVSEEIKSSELEYDAGRTALGDLLQWFAIVGFLDGFHDLESGRENKKVRRCEINHEEQNP